MLRPKNCFMRKVLLLHQMRVIIKTSQLGSGCPRYFDIYLILYRSMYYIYNRSNKAFLAISAFEMSILKSKITLNNSILYNVTFLKRISENVVQKSISAPKCMVEDPYPASGLIKSERLIELYCIFKLGVISPCTTSIILPIPTA